MNYKNIPRFNDSKKIDYKRELLKYRRAVMKLNSNVRQKNKNLNQINAIVCEDFLFDIPLDIPALKIEATSITDKNEPVIDNYEQGIIDKIMQLDQEPMITFQEEYGIKEEMDFFEQTAFLYHGIRHDNQLEIFEKILRTKNILAGKYIDGYSSFDDNCNDGEYVSLICYSDSVEFETFVRNNICFVISPFVEAYKTKHLSCDEWDYMKKNKLTVKNRFSYAWFEYQVKDKISLEQVRAIGISLLHMKLTKGHDVANQYKQQTIDLLEKYSIELPIVDIDCYNSVLYFPNKEKIKNKH